MALKGRVPEAAKRHQIPLTKFKTDCQPPRHNRAGPASASPESAFRGSQPKVQRGSASPSWADLPADVLSAVLAHFSGAGQEEEDRWSAQAVCRRWYWHNKQDCHHASGASYASRVLDPAPFTYLANLRRRLSNLSSLRVLDVRQTIAPGHCAAALFTLDSLHFVTACKESHFPMCSRGRHVAFTNLDDNERPRWQSYVDLGRLPPQAGDIHGNFWYGNSTYIPRSMSHPTLQKITSAGANPGEDRVDNERMRMFDAFYVAHCRLTGIN
ncbi:hypothetical protein WJX73_008587 [Symbiochloris irregularis]|uniref:F-box domain-containing protein n=1 Tax=Symbiochloris irregularis TaxID=706552 RepID=A0AAW1P3R3_9CHLO